VQNRTPIFLPPNPERAAGEVPLGTVHYSARDSHPFALREPDLMHHVGIFGATGTGKTNTAHLLASGIQKRGIPMWVFDFKRSWRELRSLPEFADLLVFTVGRSDVAPFSFNPLIPPAGVDVHAWIKKIAHAVSHAFFLGQGVLYLLEVTLLRLYQDFGILSGSSERHPTFRDVLRLLKNYPIKSGRESLWLSSAMRAIHSLCFGQMDRVVNCQSNDAMSGIVGRAVVFEMDSLAHEDRLFFSECAMLWLYEYYQARQARERLQHVLVVEEAHNIAGRHYNEDASSRAIMDTLFRQSREYGLGLVIIDQMPSAISKTALANVHCLVATGVKERADAVALAGAMLLDEEQRDALGRLPLGTAIVRVQRKGIEDSFMIRSPLVPIRKGEVTDEALKALMEPFCRYTEQLKGDAADGSGTEDDPRQGGHGVGSAHPKLTNSEMELLKDVAILPTSGIVARYTRLGLSGRQGDKAKRSLLGLGLIEEEEKLTSKGRSKVVRLTESGKALLESLVKKDGQSRETEPNASDVPT
jgi:hypothetical protein